jgi:glycosyltransferase involved in cell wall biosynthesis
MEKLRILFVIDHLGGGGAERQFINLVNSINRQKFESHVFITEKKGDRFRELDEHVKFHGLTDSQRRRTLKAFGLLRKCLLDIKPHIIQTWLDYSTFLTALVVKTIRSRPRFVASLRTSTKELYGYEVRFGRLKKSMLIWAFKQADAVTTNSRFLMQQLRNYDVEKVKVIYNGMNLDDFWKLLSREDLRNKLGLDPDTFYVIFVGSLVERKGLAYLIDAVRRIRRDNVRLLILGDGELREKVERLAAEDKNIIFLGYKHNAVEYAKASDLLVLPSIYEGLPNVVLEAMAIGTPVIATNIYGISELIQDNVNGLLVPPRNVEEIVRAVTHMIDDPEASRQFATISRERVNFFTVQRMTGEYENLYTGLYLGGAA